MAAFLFPFCLTYTAASDLFLQHSPVLPHFPSPYLFLPSLIITLLCLDLDLVLVFYYRLKGSLLAVGLPVFEPRFVQIPLCASDPIFFKMSLHLVLSVHAKKAHSHLLIFN